MTAYALTLGFTLVLAVAQVSVSAEEDTCITVMNANNWECNWDLNHRTSTNHYYDLVEVYGLKNLQLDEGYTKDDVLPQCCPDSCSKVMEENNWTCSTAPAGTSAPDWYMHDPYLSGTLMENVQNECCVHTCSSLMSINDWECVTGSIKGYLIFPGSYENTMEGVQNECCQETCSSVMATNNYTCPDDLVQREDKYVQSEEFRNIYKDSDTSGEILDEVDIIDECCGDAPFLCIENCMENYMYPMLRELMENNGDEGPTGEQICNMFHSLDCKNDIYLNTCDDADRIRFNEGMYEHWDGCRPLPLSLNNKMECGGGLFLKNKNSDNEYCKSCPKGKFSPDHIKRPRRCKKCPKNSYMPMKGSDKCMNCPEGFDTKGQRGKHQCFMTITGESMKSLQMLVKDANGDFSLSLH